VSLPVLPSDERPREPVETVIRRRGSTREFAPVPISAAALGTLLAASLQGVPSDFQGEARWLVECYLIVNAVEGLPSGTYYYHPAEAALEPLARGSFRMEAGFLDLGQPLAADAAVNVYALADLRPILAALGNRGYRVAQLDASIAAGKLYLSTYALGLGATGLTFFDDAVTHFFSPHAVGKSVLFLTAIGQPARGRRG
jgi:SagB-type dehydrogenase family enzyme